MSRAAEWLTRRGGATRCAFIAVVVGLVVTAMTPTPAWLGWCGLAIAAAALTACVVFRRPMAAVWWVLLLALCAGLLVGAVRVSSLTRSSLRSHVGSRCTLIGVVGSPLVRTAWGARSLLVAEAVDLDDGGSLVVGRESVQLEVSGEQSSVLPTEGTRLRVSGRLIAPSDGTDGGFDQQTRLRREGVAVILRASADDLAVVGARAGLAGMFDRLREEACRHLDVGLRPREAGWLLGVVMGRQDAVDPVTVAALRRSGTAHILSVGGMHLAALAAVMVAAVRLLRGPRLLGYLLGGAAAWLFVPLVGASPPVMRAAVVLLFVLVAEFSGRGRDRWQIFAAAAALALALNPFSLYSLSFQLSFVAAAGLMVLTRPVQRRLAFLPSTLSAGVATSVAATAATAPLTLLAFDQVAVMGVGANLLVVPVLPAVMAAGLASIVAGFVWHPLSAALNIVAAACMAWVAWVAQIAARGPVLTGARLAPAAGVVGGGLLAWAGLRRRGRAGSTGGTAPRHAWPWLRATVPMSVVVFGVGAVAGLLAVHAYGAVSSAATAARGAEGWPAETEVRVLDVGEGSATLIRTANRHAILVDAGPAGAGLARQLSALGVGTLDVVVVTHPHADHYGGLAELAGSVRISTLADHVRVSGSDGEYARMVADWTRTGTRHVALSDGATIVLGGAELRVRAPPELVDSIMLGNSISAGGGAAGADGGALNAASLVVTVRAGGLAILLPGDAEAATLERYAPSHVDVLVVPHHGSRAAVTARLLARLSARLAIVPVGPNSFGHPAARTLTALAAAKVAVLRTDRAGWVAVGSEDGRVAWQRATGGQQDTVAVVKR